MIYSCDLPSGQTLYLENQGEMTNATVLMKQSGQQQQSGSSVMTGAWQIPPQVFLMGGGAVVRLTTARGVWSLMVQGMGLSVQSGVVEVGDQVMPLTPLSQMPNVASSSFSMQPMQPMQPMTMNPMQMQMGNMGMSMGGASSQASSSVSEGNSVGNGAASPSRDSPGKASSNVKFCSQCGTGVKVGDRFCSSCGHSLG
ncbi:MAG: zinc ribbon domain-containing protein [Cyanobacteria bacterium]|nr:zinc ribbon domain-containing protein [Cyanobacteriota bacterium]